ncbi:hypothetical protein [Rhodovulum visakhapatnamense]|uniref:hypothetical protein n=1 Tax=Rhodovulum visakhapatnamense TaxID=364297 RepID=UPI0015B86277|nr:hypothetical protein [Rhodovulum visakhapatnamense]
MAALLTATPDERARWPDFSRQTHQRHGPARNGRKDRTGTSDPFRQVRDAYNGSEAVISNLSGLVTALRLAAEGLPGSTGGAPEWDAFHAILRPAERRAEHLTEVRGKEWAALTRFGARSEGDREEVLDLLIAARRASGRSLDFWADPT